MLVSADNFTRAESDLYFGNVVKDGGFGKFKHIRQLTPVDKQLVIRSNRDTLYSAGVFDLDAGPVTISLPDAHDRFMSLQVISEDHYVPDVFYGQGEHTLTRDGIGTRYVMAAIRTLVDPNDEADAEKVHALQDAVAVKQDSSGSFEIPEWDPVSHKSVRDALLQLAATPPDSKGTFGTRSDTDPIRHRSDRPRRGVAIPKKMPCISASARPATTAPPRTGSASTRCRSTASGRSPSTRTRATSRPIHAQFTPNPQNAYSLNNITAQRGPDGQITIRFGGRDGTAPNCLPITPGWNYLVRLYRPHHQILDGEWKFPEAQPIS